MTKLEILAKLGEVNADLHELLLEVGRRRRLITDKITLIHEVVRVLEEGTPVKSHEFVVRRQRKTNPMEYQYYRGKITTPDNQVEALWEDSLHKAFVFTSRDQANVCIVENPRGSGPGTDWMYPVVESMERIDGSVKDGESGGD